MTDEQAPGAGAKAPKTGDQQLQRLVRGEKGDPENPGDVSPRGKPVGEHPEGLPDTIK